MKGDSIKPGNSEEVYEWFGQKVMWGGMEATKLCKIFHALTRIVDAE